MSANPVEPDNLAYVLDDQFRNFLAAKIDADELAPTVQSALNFAFSRAAENNGHDDMLTPGGYIGRLLTLSRYGEVLEIIENNAYDPGLRAELLDSITEKHSGGSFNKMVEHLFRSGLDVDDISPQALYNLFKSYPSLHDRADLSGAFERHANTLMGNALGESSHIAAQKLLDGYAKHLSDVQGLLPRALATEKDDLIKVFLENPLYAEAYQARADWYMDIIQRRNIRLHTVALDWVKHKPEYLGAEYLRFMQNLDSGSQFIWAGFDSLAASGLNLNQEGCNANALFENALQNSHSFWDCAFHWFADSGAVDPYIMARAACRAGQGAPLAQVYETYGLKIEKVDFDAPENTDDPNLIAFIKLLEDERHQELARRNAVLCEVSRAKLKSMTQTGWFKPGADGESPLQKLAGSNKLMDLLINLEREQGMRLTADDFLAPDGDGISSFDRIAALGQAEKFLTSSYWRGKPRALKMFFEQLSPAKQSNLQNVMDRHIKSSRLSSARASGLKLRRR